MRVVVVTAAAVFGIAASPAFANSSATDIVAPVRQAQGETITSGDTRFQQLFASWEALDPTGPVAQPTVAIPSRMPLENMRMTSDYGMRSHPILGGRRNHKGVDLAAPSGTPVYATADGIIGKAEWYSSYGLYVQIEHGADLETRYAHMSRLAVASGERVRKGDVIGYVGSTGRSTGPHLHYEVRVDGVAVNPVPYMLEADSAATLALAYSDGGQGGD